MHCDPHVEGRPWPYAPRVILKKVLARAAEMGLEINVGTEIEYFLVNKDENGALRTADALDTSRQPATTPATSRACTSTSPPSRRR